MIRKAIIPAAVYGTRSLPITKVLPKVHIQYIRQSYAGGLGQSTLLGKHFSENEPFAVLLPDKVILSEKKPPGVGGEFQLIDAIQMMLDDSPSYGMEIEGNRFDSAKQADYIKLTNLIYNASQPKQ